jgi:hypothetical protein
VLPGRRHIVLFLAVFAYARRQLDRVALLILPVTATQSTQTGDAKYQILRSKYYSIISVRLRLSALALSWRVEREVPHASAEATLTTAKKERSALVDPPLRLLRDSDSSRLVNPIPRLACTAGQGTMSPLGRRRRDLKPQRQRYPEGLGSVADEATEVSGSAPFPTRGLGGVTVGSQSTINTNN